MTEREKLHATLKNKISSMGYPPEFGAAIADQLRTEKAMSRMIGYLLHGRSSPVQYPVDGKRAVPLKV